jgi:large subunit ribosomal protein L29
MKASELRELGDVELGTRERELNDQLFRLRIQKSMGQLEAPAKMRGVRRDLARVKTVLRQKRT